MQTIRAVLAAALYFASLQTPQPISQPPSEASFHPLHATFFGGGIVAVEVECPPGTSRMVLLDSGTPDESGIQSAPGVGSGGSATLRLGIGGATKDVEAAVDPSIADVLPAVKGTKLAGIVGTDLMEGVQFAFDYEKKTLHARVGATDSFEKGMELALAAMGRSGARSKLIVLDVGRDQDGYYRSTTTAGTAVSIPVVDTCANLSFLAKGSSAVAVRRVDGTTSSGPTTASVGLSRVSLGGVTRVFAVGLREDDAPSTISVPGIAGDWAYLDLVHGKLAFALPTKESDAAKAFTGIFGNVSRVRSGHLELAYGAEPFKWAPLVSVGDLDADQVMVLLERSGTDDAAWGRLQEAAKAWGKLTSVTVLEDGKPKSIDVNKMASP